MKMKMKMRLRATSAYQNVLSRASRLCSGARAFVGVMSSAKYLDPPKYPVIFDKPSIGTTIGNFNFRDFVKITALTSVAMPFGYLTGGSANLRGPSMYTAALIGLTGGYMWAYQSSAGRLMGFFPNDDEVAKYKS